MSNGMGTTRQPYHVKLNHNRLNAVKAVTLGYVTRSNTETANEIHVYWNRISSAYKLSKRNGNRKRFDSGDQKTPHKLN